MPHSSSHALHTASTWQHTGCALWAPWAWRSRDLKATAVQVDPQGVLTDARQTIGHQRPWTGNPWVIYGGRIADVLRAVADPIRRAFIDELRERNDQSLSELCMRLMSRRGIHVTRQAVSKHLAVLRDAGLLSFDRVGRTSIYHLNSLPLNEPRDWLDL